MIDNLLRSCVATVMAFMAFAVSAQAQLRLPSGADMMHVVLTIDGAGVNSKEVYVGIPQTVDQHTNMGWFSSKLKAANLSGLPDLALDSGSAQASASLAVFEAALETDRQTKFPAFSKAISTWLRQEQVPTAWIDIKQRVTHLGASKWARSSVLVTTSGYWHSTRAKVRRDDGELRAVYASYRARRDLSSPAEADEIPPSADPNETSQQLGLWMNIKKLSDWTNVTQPAAVTITERGNEVFGNFRTFSNKRYHTPDPSRPGWMLEDPQWPGRCLLDRSYVSSVVASRVCPNNQDLRSLWQNYDADMIILDYFAPVDWKRIETGPSTFRADYFLDVTQRNWSNACGSVFANTLFYNQQATLTGTMRVVVDRYVMFPDNRIERIQQFNLDVPLRYPYNAAFAIETRPGQYDTCGRDFYFNKTIPYRKFVNGPTLPYCKEYYTGAAVIGLPNLTANTFVQPRANWWAGGDKGPWTTLSADTVNKGFTQIDATMHPTANYRFAAWDFIADSCTTTTCPSGQILVNGVCTNNTNGCPAGAYVHPSTGACLTCPAKGMVLDGTLTCVCPTCQVDGFDSTGARACVTDPAPTLPVCQVAPTSCGAIASQIGYIRMKTLLGSTEAAPLFWPNCPHCEPDETWNNSFQRCERDIPDRCTNIPGVQQFVPLGMIEQNGICTTPLPQPLCACGEADVTFNPGSSYSGLGTWASVLGSVSSFTGTIDILCRDTYVGNTNNRVTIAAGSIVRTESLPRSGTRSVECASPNF